MIHSGTFFWRRSLLQTAKPHEAQEEAAAATRSSPLFSSSLLLHIGSSPLYLFSNKLLISDDGEWSSSNRRLKPGFCCFLPTDMDSLSLQLKTRSRRTVSVAFLLRTVCPFSSSQLLLKGEQETHQLIQLLNKGICRLSGRIRTVKEPRLL